MALDEQLGTPYTWLLITIGGALGTLIRHFIMSIIPLGLYYNKIIVNILSCFLLGYGFKHYQKDTKMYPFFVIGFSLAMSCFASYMFQLVDLYKKQKWTDLFIFFCISNIVCFIIIYYMIK
jgi:fluoride ion exporter CrcB/FEX